MQQEVDQAIKIAIASTTASKATSLAVANVSSVTIAKTGLLMVARTAATSAVPAIAVGVIAYTMYSLLFASRN